MVKVRLCFLSVWTFLDPIYYLFTRLTYLKDEEENSSVLRVRLTRYKGRPFTLSDGTVIQKNDLLIKIHLHNVKILKALNGLQGETAKGRMIYQQVKKSLPSLALFLNNHHNSSEIKGIIGITMLNKGCHRLGFQTFNIKNIYYRLIKHMVFIPMYCLSVNSISRLALKRPPKYLFMSRESLLANYLKN